MTYIWAAVQLITIGIYESKEREGYGNGYGYVLEILGELVAGIMRKLGR